jgi:23S rRNA (uracil1939-C5)-methyltransferase
VRPRPRRSSPPPDPDDTPKCRHFGTCGGCSLLDQPIRWQLHDKLAAAEKLLAPFLAGQRIACDEPDRAPRHFRTRLLYPVRADRDGLPVVGIYEFQSHKLVRIEECKTQDVWLTDLGKAMETILREQRVQPYSPTSQRGVAKAVWARLASGTGEVLAGVVTRPGTFPQGPAFAEALTKAARTLPYGRFARELVGVVHSISDRDDEFLLGDRHMPLRGRDHVVDRRDDLDFRVSAGSFYQVHAAASALLYAPAMALCGDVKGLRIVDGYGGVGGFGLRLARRGAAEVTIVEDNEAACRDAEHNAKKNGLATVRVLPQPYASAQLPEKPDLLVVDPPRAGLGEKGVLRTLRSQPRRILYVACAADSLARDLGVLCASGYSVTAARLCDLFPHTEHVELMVRLEAAGG